MKNFDLSVGKRSGRAGTYQEGLYPITEGYFGPFGDAHMNQAGALLGGRFQRVCTQREFLLAFGVIAPSLPGDVEFLANRAAEIQKALTGAKEAAAAPKEPEFVPQIKRFPDPDEVVVEPAVPASAETLGLADDPKAEEESVVTETVQKAVVSSIEEIEPPDDFQPNYDEALKEMREAGYEYDEIFGIRKRPKAAEARAAFYAFKKGIVVA